MTAENIIQEAKRTGAELTFAPDGALYSMDPPETLFGFTVHSHMIPPFRPENTVILGYGGGTVASLMRMVWGHQIKITGIDAIKFDSKYVEFKMRIMDAWKFIKECTNGLFKTKYDYVCVDLWSGHKVPDFVFTPEFATRISEMTTRMVSINVRHEDMRRLQELMYSYGDFNFERGDLVWENVVMWWSKSEED